MNHVILRSIFVAAHSTAEYIPGEGAICPVCHGILGQRNRGRVVRTDGEIRYCVCELCGINFKSVEKTMPKPDVIEPIRRSPETMDAKPKRRHIRSRKR